MLNFFTWTILCLPWSCFNCNVFTICSKFSMTPISSSMMDTNPLFCKFLPYASFSLTFCLQGDIFLSLYRWKQAAFPAVLGCSSFGVSCVLVFLAFGLCGCVKAELGLRMSMCVCAYVFVCVCVCMCVLTGGGVST